jgi:tetratricopeptide (TPR) repeat protein
VYDQGLEEARRAARERPNFVVPFLLEGKGLYQEAAAEFEKLGNSAGIRGHLAHAYIRTGRMAEARTILRELQLRAQQDGVGSYELGFLYGALGNKDEAFEWLDKAYWHRDTGLTFLKVDTTLDPLRADPRFLELERRVGLSP